jgi:transcriptional regulator GlxA family with amidase domain
MPKIDIAPKRLGFLLIDGFALMSYASVIEPFRAANTLSGHELYRWFHVSVDGRAARASNGVNVLAESSVGGAIDVDTLFVVAGGDPTRFNDRPTLGWLRRLAKSGAHLAGVSGGPFILARAGVLDGYRCTIHWEHAPAFEQRFPTHMLETGIYVIDRGRMTCAGGTAGLDLAVELIEREHGRELGVQVSEWFIRTQSRPPEGKQRISLRERYAVRNAFVLKTLARMEDTIEHPDDCTRLARRVGISLRQLERLFAVHMGCSVKQAYLGIRLTHADLLLHKTGMSITAISAACGFANISHFSRSYKQKFGHTPSSGT